MAFGNQWMNPAFYKNMNNEQVDWANLAQQWIKMKETTPAVPPGQQGRSTTCEPNFPGSSQSIDSQNTSNVLGSHNTLGENNIVGSMAGNNVEKPSAWNTWTWQQQQQWNWNWASSSTAPPTKTPTIEPITPIRQPYVAPSLLTEPPPSFPILSPNKQFTTNNFWAGPRIPTPVESSDQWNKNMLSNIDDRSQDSSYIDAAKRKQLPAWIREGLEKMEREKRRKMEREQSSDENENSNFHTENNVHELHHSPHNFDHESQIVDEETEHDSPDGYNDDTESTKTEYLKNDPSPLIPRKTKAQIWEDTMLVLRQILTKLLMDVTNDMMLSIVREVLKSAIQTDIQGNQSQTSLAGKLGLGVYGTESESSEESDDEQHATSLKQSSKLDSDAAIQERILKRQREFSNIEARILMELDQLEDREKLVRSKFDTSVKLSGDINDNGSQVVENIQPKGRNVDEGGSSQKIDKASDKNKKVSSNYLSIKNGQKKKKSKSKRSSSSSESSSSSSSSSSGSSSESKKSDDTDSKYSYRKNDKVKSKYSNKKHKTDSVKRKRTSRSKNRSRSHSRSKRSRSRSRRRSNSRSRHDRRSPHSYKSRRSRSPVSRHGSSRKYKSKRNSSSSSNESRNTKHRYRR